MPKKRANSNHYYDRQDHSRSSRPRPLFQSEVKCHPSDMEMNFFHYSHAIKSHFHEKGFVFCLFLKVTDFGSRKWPITSQTQNVLTNGCGGEKVKGTRSSVPVRNPEFQI